MSIEDGSGPHQGSEPPGLPGDVVGNVTGLMVEHLKGTRPWVRFLAIFGFVMCGIMALLSVGVAFAGFLASQFGPVQGVLLGALYLVFAVIYFVPCLYLLRYAGAIRRFEHGGGIEAIEEALGWQKSFWRLVGIIGLVMLCLYAAILVLGILALVLAALR